MTAYCQINTEAQDQVDSLTTQELYYEERIKGTTQNNQRRIQKTFSKQ